MLGRLKAVQAGYHLDRCCMEGTRQSLLDQIIDWVANRSDQNNNLQSNTYWLFGSPGMGKTTLAHSICANFHDREQLAGAFFCRRDDPDLSKPRNIIPTLINELAGIFPPFRRIVAKHLQNDPNLRPESMRYSLILDLIQLLPCRPEQTLVFVIDALDECGDAKSRPPLLKALTDATTCIPWLRIIITSRPENDIERFFNRLPLSSYSACNLSTDQAASDDLRVFARSRFDFVARSWTLSTPWPEESLFNEAISQANGLFIFVETVALALEKCADPTKSLEATVRGSASSSLKPLYGLYSSILDAQIVHSHAEFRKMFGVLLIVAQYRALHEETIAELAGMSPILATKWVNDLSSLLYRDEGADGGIRVRHLSISDFFLSDSCQADYRVNLEDANAQLGIACLRTMIGQLRFNICELEDSRLANADVKDLPSQIKKNISDALQYSSLYWSNHVCFSPNGGNLAVCGNLKEFFEGVYPLFWIEVLSIMGMVPIGAPTLRRMITWAKVRIVLACHWFSFHDGSNSP